MKRAIILLFTCIFGLSCKKAPPEYPDLMTGDTAVFVGSWEWKSSDHYYGNCINMSFYEMITPMSSGQSKKLVIAPIGVLNYLVNDSIKASYELFSSGFYPSSFCQLSNNYRFEFYLNNNKETRLRGCVSADSMIITNGFLYEDYEEGCETYTSYLIKQ